MRANRRRDTKPELKLRRELFKRGMRYRVDFRVGNGKRAPRADIGLPRARGAVFVDGCFWHGCRQHGVRPTQNVAYWDAKLARNRERDRRISQQPEAEGWYVIRVWEHEDPAMAADEIVAI